MSVFTKNSKPAQLYELKTLWDEGVDGVDCYIVLATDEKDAIITCLRNVDNNLLSYNWGNFFNDYPDISNDDKFTIEEFISLYESNSINDLSTLENEEDLDIYKAFVENHLDLIVSVFFILNENTRLFSIHETIIIS